MSMTKGIRGWRGRLALAAVAALAMATNAARAELTVVVVYNGTATPFTSGTGTFTADAGQLAALNATIAAAGGQFTFTNLQATTTSPIGNPGVLFQNVALTNNNGADANPIQVFANSTDYTAPTAATSMSSGSSSNWANSTSADTTTFQSWFDPSNTALNTTPPITPTGQPGTPIPLTSAGGIPVSTRSGEVVDAILSGTTTYGLTNLTTITLGGRTSTASPATIQSQGTTTVVATAVPEPATFAAALVALVPAAFAVRRRRARA